MQIRYTLKAVHNLEEIADYLVQRNPQAARRVRTKIEEALDILVQFPDSGKEQTTANVRKFVVRRYPYLIYYSIDADADELVVLSVQHPKRKREHDDS